MCFNIMYIIIEIITGTKRGKIIAFDFECSDIKRVYHAI